MNEKLFIIAIGINCDRSGFCFSSARDWNDIKPYIWMGDIIQSPTSPSVLLLNPDASFHSFGYEAEDNYAMLLDDGGNYEDYYYFCGLPFLLEHNPDKSVPELHGKVLDSKKVLQAIIEHFIHLLISLRENSIMDHVLKTSDIFVIFTVPGCNEKLAELFLKCAEELNLRTDQVSIVTESLATTICYQSHSESGTSSQKHIDAEDEQFPSFESVESSDSSEPIRKSIILKIEGRFSEVAVIHDGKLRMISRKFHRQGGAFASFIRYISEELDRDSLQKKLTENYSEYSELERRFEYIRRKVKREKPLTMRIKLPHSVYEQSRSDVPINKKTILTLNPDAIEDIYKSTFQSSLDLMKNFTRQHKLSKMDIILICGEFSDNVVTANIKESLYEMNIHRSMIKELKKPSLAALTGAVLYGCEYMKSRNTSVQEVIDELKEVVFSECEEDETSVKTDDSCYKKDHHLFKASWTCIRKWDIEDCCLHCKADMRNGFVSSRLNGLNLFLEYNLFLEFTDDFKECDVHSGKNTYGARQPNNMFSSLNLEIRGAHLDIVTYTKGINLSEFRIGKTCNGSCLRKRHNKMSNNGIFTENKDFLVMWNLLNCNEINEQKVRFILAYAKRSGNCILKRAVIKTLITLLKNEFSYETLLACVIQLNDIKMLNCLAWTVTRLFYDSYHAEINIADIWPGYRHSFSTETSYHLAVFHTTELKQPVQKFKGFFVEYRMEDDVNLEAKEVMLYEQKLTKSVEVNIEFPIADKSIRKLFKAHKNLCLISNSRIKSSLYSSKTNPHKIAMEPCVVLYCKMKGIIPIGEYAFPESIEDRKTDVREGFCFLAADTGSLKMGEQICARTLQSPKYASIGGFCDLPNNRIGLITCAHGVFDDNILQQAIGVNGVALEEFIDTHEIPVTSPPARKPIGKVTKAVFYVDDPGTVSVDAALIELHNRLPVDGSFKKMSQEDLAKNGFSGYQQPDFSTGEIVSISSENCRYPMINIGASSGISKGTLQLSRSHAKVCEKLVSNARENPTLQYRMYNQHEVQPSLNEDSDIRNQAFITQGDSGSFVFMQFPDGRLKCAGMVVAVTSYGSCLMTPIANVLTDLNLKNQLKQFSSSNNESEPQQLSQTDILLLIKEKVDKIPNLEEKCEVIPSLQTSVQKIDIRLQETNQRVSNIEQRNNCTLI